MIKGIDVNPLLDEYIDKCIGHSETSTIEVHVDYNTTIEDKINQVLKNMKMIHGMILISKIDL